MILFCISCKLLTWNKVSQERAKEARNKESALSEEISPSEET